MNKQMWEVAERLASKLYSIEVSIETLLDGTNVYFVETPELEGCMAHGSTLDEALDNIREARTEYIYSLLEDGLPVPPPVGQATKTHTGYSGAAGQVRKIVTYNFQLPMQDTADSLIEQANEIAKKSGYVPREDLVPDDDLIQPA